MVVAVAIIYAGFCLLKSRGHQPSEAVSMAERHWAQSILNKMRWTVLNGIGKKENNNGIVQGGIHNGYF